LRATWGKNLTNPSHLISDFSSQTPIRCKTFISRIDGYEYCSQNDGSLKICSDFYFHVFVKYSTIKDSLANFLNFYHMNLSIPPSLSKQALC